MTCTLGQSYDSSGNYVGNTAAAWSSFTPSSDTHIFYVSNAGNNATGVIGDPAHPFADPWHIFGNHLLRRGYPDWVLFRKGDSWPDGFGTLPGDCSGRSASEPMVFGSYDGANPSAGVNPASGGARPLFNVPVGSGGYRVAATDGGGWSAGSGNYLAFVGLDFYAFQRDPANPSYNYNAEYNGMAFYNKINFMLIEDCKFSFFTGMIYFEGHYAAPIGQENCIVRRSVITDAWRIPYNVSGMYTNLAQTTLEECVFDHNGWNETNGTGYGSVFNHNFYLQGIDGANTSVVPSGDVALPATVRGNILSYDCTGSQVRMGGTIWDNCCIRNPYPHNIGSPDYKTKRANTIAWNVYIEGCDAPAGEAYGWGVSNFTHYSGDNQNYNYGTLVFDHNIICHTAVHSGNGFAIGLYGMPDGITISNNIVFDWQQPYLQSDSTCTLINNDISDDASHFPDPSRSVGSYFATLGLGGGNQTTDFIKAARGQSKANWNPALTAHALNNYIREGFGMSGLGTTPPPVEITIAPAMLPEGTVGVAYSQTVTASGGTAPYAYSKTGQLPAGLTLSNSGVISGTPTAAGASSFSVKATDSGSASGTHSYSITIAASQPVPGVIILSPSTLPGGTVGKSYSQTITASGGTAPYSFTSIGTLPAGLALSTSGTLSGTPSAVATSSFSVKATDAASTSGSQAYTLAIVAGQPAEMPVSGVVAITMSTATLTERKKPSSPPGQQPPGQQPPATTIQTVNVSGAITVGADRYQWQGPATDAGGGNYNFSATATKVAYRYGSPVGQKPTKSEDD
jgi:hypothetical protein